MRRHVIISVIVMSLLMTAAIASAKERVFYYHNDHLGTPQVMTDEAGVTVWEAEYLPFGEAAVNEDPDGDGVLVVSNIRFPGQYYDSETGLHYNWHRDYQPRTGRYLEADPIGIDKAENHLYTYTGNNPVRHYDFSGLFCVVSAKWIQGWDISILSHELPSIIDILKSAAGTGISVTVPFDYRVTGKVLCRKECVGLKCLPFYKEQAWLIDVNQLRKGKWVGGVDLWFIALSRMISAEYRNKAKFNNLANSLCGSGIYW